MEEKEINLTPRSQKSEI